MKVKILTAIWDGKERIEAGVIRDRKDGEELVNRGLAIPDEDAASGTGASDRIPCPHCGKTYASEETLAKHIAEKHPDKLE